MIIIIDITTNIAVTMTSLSTTIIATTKHQRHHQFHYAHHSHQLVIAIIVTSHDHHNY
jgi:hypothetical protein